MDDPKLRPHHEIGTVPYFRQGIGDDNDRVPRQVAQFATICAALTAKAAAEINGTTPAIRITGSNPQLPLAKIPQHR